MVLEGKSSQPRNRRETARPDETHALGTRGLGSFQLGRAQGVQELCVGGEDGGVGSILVRGCDRKTIERLKERTRLSGTRCNGRLKHSWHARRSPYHAHTVREARRLPAQWRHRLGGRSNSDNAHWGAGPPPQGSGLSTPSDSRGSRSTMVRATISMTVTASDAMPRRAANPFGEQVPPTSDSTSCPGIRFKRGCGRRIGREVHTPGAGEDPRGRHD